MFDLDKYLALLSYTGGGGALVHCIADKWNGIWEEMHDELKADKAFEKL